MLRSKWFIVAVALQALFLIGLACTFYAADWMGREIRLRTAPVDPRDYLYGDYVILSYEMSQLNTSLWQGGSELPDRGDTVYVALAPDTEGIYAPVAFYPNRAAVPEEQVLIRALVEYQWDHIVTVKYGLERYYVPEGTGETLQRQAGNLLVTVKVAPWGQTVITGVEAR